MFEIDGDLILFDGNPVARFEASAWPTLRDEVVAALEACDPDVDAPLEEKIDELETELREARSDIKGYVREIAELTAQLEDATQSEGA